MKTLPMVLTIVGFGVVAYVLYRSYQSGQVDFGVVGGNWDS